MNILMLSDFSSNANHAHRYALALYKGQPIKTFLLHVKKPCLGLQKCSGKCKLGLYQKLAKAAQALVNGDGQAAPKPILTEGSFIEEVRAAVIKYNIDVLVIGAKGKSEKHSLRGIGTNTKAIATKVKCPVFIVFEQTPIDIPKSVLFPVNYTDALYPVCLNKLKKLPNWESLSFKVVELKPLTTAIHLVMNAKQILEDSLRKNSVEYQTYTHSDIVLNQEASNYSIMIFAAKNLSVGNQIFSELLSKEASAYKTPLFVLHA